MTVEGRNPKTEWFSSTLAFGSKIFGGGAIVVDVRVGICVWVGVGDEGLLGIVPLLDVGVSVFKFMLFSTRIIGGAVKKKKRIENWELKNEKWETKNGEKENTW